FCRLNPFVFFFQAEDGIRDFHVTGVQTCALPIFRPSARRVAWDASPRVLVVLWRYWRDFAARALPPPRAHVSSTCPHPGSTIPRSEERRVGKEGRSQWGA